jgi:enamine deaminase RidA (YjgF/YER057c/UK114 family)
VDVVDLPAVTEVKAAYLTRDFAAWTAIGVTALAFPGQLLEIKATALARAG